MNVPAARTVYEVSELADLLRALVEDALPRIWVQGEVSNLSRPASGHWYFTLKDARAQLRCVMFRNANLYIRPLPKDGDQVLVRAQASVYSARGDLQLICEHLEPAGEGALLRAFEELKRRLAAEGLFDPGLKRPLPRLPRAIGVITSATGAAIQDIQTTLARRFPLAPVYLYPVPVQGKEAPGAIVRALRELPARAAVDVVILARGGGSLEDLWAFNDEQVARAIRACRVPVVCGVGHEVDVTIADFAADLRAPTPTAAAEQVAPDVADWRATIADSAARLRHAAQARLATAQERTQALAARLHAQHPGRRLQDRAQRLDECSLRTQRAIGQHIADRRQRLQHAQARLQAAAPQAAIQRMQHRLDDLRGRLHAAPARRLAGADAQLLRASALLDSLNPRAVLHRGYAIALDAHGQALTDARHTSGGESLRLILAAGEVDARVTATRAAAPPR